MTPQEFERTWTALNDKLTTAERELVDAVIKGAEVNYSLVYMALASLLGGAGGWCLARMWG